jgi:hypothetical protein
MLEEFSVDEATDILVKGYALTWGREATDEEKTLMSEWAAHVGLMRDQIVAVMGGAARIEKCTFCPRCGHGELVLVGGDYPRLDYRGALTYVKKAYGADAMHFVDSVSMSIALVRVVGRKMANVMVGPECILCGNPLVRFQWRKNP